ncbi:YbaB/EbfC family nucleoid-associated protein [Candidatus Neomarinimicrobiota bacterium]
MFPKSSMASMLNQAKQVQSQLEELQGELANLRIEGQSGGGVVKAVSNGQQDLISIKIDESLLEEDVEMIEDLVVAAVRQAISKSREESQQRMNGITGGMLGGLNLPGM